MNDKKLYNISEVADILNMNKETIRRWHRLGKIKTVQVGNGLIRIPESEVNRLLGEEKKCDKYISIRVTQATRDRLVACIPPNVSYDHFINDAIDILCSDGDKK